MWLKLEQLNDSLKKNLAPVYFLTGDEPLQMGEAADAVRLLAKQAGYANREILNVDANFSWSTLLQEADSFSLFADKKIIDLRIPSGKVGAEGSKALIAYCQRLPEDTILLISAGKLEKSAKKSKWASCLEKTGVALQIWPLAGRDLIQWLQRRLQKRGLILDLSEVQIIATRVEGNLLAAAQEVEKLYALYGSGTLSAEQVNSVVVDSSRYDVFNLVDAALSGRVERVQKILSGLQQEGIAASVVLWALAREIRNLIHIQKQLAEGQAQHAVFMRYQVWDKRQKLVQFALSHLKRPQLLQALLLAAKTDRQIKGEEVGSCWRSLLQISLILSNASDNL